MKTSNTILSDINELYIAFILADSRWFDTAAESQYNMRLQQANPHEVTDAQNKAIVMVDAFKEWAKSNGYGNIIRQVWWTARPGSMSRAFGEPVDQKKNPTDVLVRFNTGPSKGYLGLSAKATKGKSDIGFKNPGIGTIDKSLSISLADDYNKQLDITIKKFKLPGSSAARKDFIRSNPKIKSETEKIGSQTLLSLRDKLLIRLNKFNQKDLLQYLLSYWMDADIILPPYVKVTGMGNRVPYKAVVTDPINNEKMSALSKYLITLEKIGNESIGVKAGSKKIMKIRFKFESEKMASSVKLSGDPW